MIALKAPPKMPTMMPKAPVNQAGIKTVTFGKVASAKGHRTLVYGPGGIGKTTLCLVVGGRIVIADIEDSLPRLKGKLLEGGIALPETLPVENWEQLHQMLLADGWQGVNSYIEDSVTRLEDWALAHTLKTVPNDKGKLMKRIEEYGYGKGYQQVYDTFLQHLSDLDRLANKGINVFLIAHDCVNNVPNPAGGDWIRYEPRLQDLKSGKSSIRLRVKEWADHVLFYGYDVVVKEGENVGTGCGTRRIYTSELPHCMAKSRTASHLGQIEVDANNLGGVWEKILV